MAITTYAELQTAIGDWAERTDLSSQHTTFISLAESRIKKTFASAGLRLRESETRSDLTPTSGVCTLPSDYAAMKKVQARTSAPRRLEFKTMDWLDEAYPDGASGDPSFYTILGGSLYMFPLTTSDIRIDYYAHVPALSVSATTNWLLTKYPDVYLFASLIELATYAQDEAGKARWGSDYANAIEGLKGAAFAADITPGTSRTASQAAW